VNTVRRFPLQGGKLHCLLAIYPNNGCQTTEISLIDRIFLYGLHL
jgi:hypothetical protein